MFLYQRATLSVLLRCKTDNESFPAATTTWLTYVTPSITGYFKTKILCNMPYIRNQQHLITSFHNYGIITF